MIDFLTTITDKDSIRCQECQKREYDARKTKHIFDIPFLS